VNSQRPGLILLLAAAFCGPCLAVSGSPFESELARLAGRSAKQCGIFPLGHEAKAGWQCVLAAEQAGQPYWFAFLGPGDDSMIGIAAIRTPEGARILLDYDSDPFGSNRQNPRFTSTTCPFEIVYEGERMPPFECRPTVVRKQ
jgi:hypothetical protein